ncbi:MAG: TIGR00730 family Rossman fold protein [Pseudomonadota bacterium]
MNNVAVYLGSSAGAQPAYADAARELGSAIAAAGMGLVYGGGKVGLMGIVADAVLAGGGSVTGVITDDLRLREVGHDGLTELISVPTMHERKALMAERADGFIAIPGGFGTLDEFFEVLTWGQLGIHAKPCGLLNVAGYFDALLSFLEHASTERFLHPGHVENLIVEGAPNTLIERLMQHQPRNPEKWLG